MVPNFCEMINYLAMTEDKKRCLEGYLLLEGV